MSAPEESVLGDALDAVDFGAIVLDDDARILRCNRWLRARARSALEPRGRRLNEWLGATVHPRLQSAVTDALARGHSARLSSALHPAPLPLYSNPADPSAARVRHAVDIVALPRGDRRRCLVQVRDMSESFRREEVLREQQRRLRESERRLAAMLDNAPIGMAVGPTSERWTYVNRALCHLVGFDAQALLSAGPRSLRHPADSPDGPRETEPSADAAGVTACEERWRHRSGRWIWVRVTRTSLPDPAGEATQLITQVESIDDRKQREQDTAEALAEKETLLREVYHRVKNNLQVIQSLLNLKRGSLSDAAARAALAETAERVRSMSLVHEKLYQSSHLSAIDLREYLRDLGSQLRDALGRAREGVQIVVDAQPVAVDLNCAIPFGLIVTELVSNSFKHAFEPERAGQIRIELRRTSQGMTLSVHDDGSGWDPAAPRRTSLGLKLVHQLSRQLGGAAHCISSPGAGTSWCVTLAPAVASYSPTSRASAVLQALG